MEENEISGYSFVHHNVVLGKGNTICEGVIIREGVQIGDNNYFGPHCIIGDYPEKHGYFDKFGKVVIGSNNRFTKHNCIFLKSAHVGHDAYIHNDVILSCNSVVGGHTIVNEKCNLGLGAVIHQRLTIPEGCMIGMNSTITKTTVLTPWRKLAGSPARDIGKNMH